MRTEPFDTVVVGSGFGGAPIARRLAEASNGGSVCVLERGKSYPPGSFPRSPASVGRNFWDPSERLYGLFNPWSFRHLNAVVSSGLGGGSLIYANVLIRKDERWFEERDPPGWRWPVTRAELDPFYDRAEQALGATPYPFERGEPYASTPKTQAMRDAAEDLQARGESLRWELPNLAVSFTPPGQDPALGVRIPEARPNFHRLPRYTCRLIGECDLGCNFGAKNSLDYTYLTEADHAGADIRCLSEVRRLSELDGGYLVEYDEHHPDSDGAPDTRRTRRQIHAKRLVLAAGTIGTTYLLLRNRATLPRLSRVALGTRFCGNGDFLSFVKKSRERTEQGWVERTIDPSRGPVITSFIRIPDGLDGQEQIPVEARGFYLQDAGYPEFANWLLQAFDLPGFAWRALNFARSIGRHYFQRDPDSDIGAELSTLLGDADLVNTSLGLLGMGRDIPDGRMHLGGSEDRLHVDWSESSSKLFFRRMSHTMERMAEALGGDYVQNPTYGWARRLVTVHPLGGCPMGRDADEGVVDSYGRVFGYENLFVSDGSVMPGPVGANPSLTIAAFAERCVDRILREDVGG